MTTIAPTDISNFMAWFINQTARIFLYTYTTLDNIQFAGTSLLRVIVFVAILTALVSIMITIPKELVGVSERVKENSRQEMKATEKRIQAQNEENARKWGIK